MCPGQLIKQEKYWLTNTNFFCNLSQQCNEDWEAFNVLRETRDEDALNETLQYSEEYNRGAEEEIIAFISYIYKSSKKCYSYDIVKFYGVSCSLL